MCCKMLFLLPSTWTSCHDHHREHVQKMCIETSIVLMSSGYWYRYPRLKIDTMRILLEKVLMLWTFYLASVGSTFWSGWINKWIFKMNFKSDTKWIEFEEVKVGSFVKYHSLPSQQYVDFIRNLYCIKNNIR